MESVIIHWGYWAILLGCFLEGETVLLIGGLIAHKGLLQLDWVILSACLGSVVGDQTWFLLGRFAGEHWLSKFRRLKAASARMTRWLQLYGIWFALGFRFIYGIRTVAPLFFGAAHYPVRRFVALNVLGASLWAIAVALFGYSLGATMQYLLGRAARIEEALLCGAGVVAFLIWWRHRPRMMK